MNAELLFLYPNRGPPTAECNHETSQPYEVPDYEKMIKQSSRRVGRPVIEIPCHVWGPARYAVIKAVVWSCIEGEPLNTAERAHVVAKILTLNDMICLPPLPRDAVMRMLPAPTQPEPVKSKEECQREFRAALHDLRSHYGGIA